MGNPYQISDANDMNEIGVTPADWDAHFLLVADVNLARFTGTQFNIIGNSSEPFAGVFDGNNHTISNFTYDSPETDKVGLFGCIYDGTRNAAIKDLGLIGPNVCGYRYIGGLVGSISYGTVSGCFVEGGNVSGYEYVGGLIGEQLDAITSNSYAVGKVYGNDYVGGLMGNNFFGTINDSYAAGEVAGNYDNIGGLVGENMGVLDDSYATGPVNGRNRVGGLVGHNLIYTINNSYAAGDVNGNDSVGGLVGYGEDIISNSYATGKVNGNDNVGGLVGCLFHNTVNNSYATGAVEGNSSVGGLAGAGSGVFYNSYWDIQTTGQSTSVGGTGKTTTEMMQKATFTSWDFINIWNIGENQTYPYIRVYPAGDLNHNGIVNMPDFAIFADHWLEGI